MPVKLCAFDMAENRRRMERGDLYYAFTPDLMADRKRCKEATKRFNAAAGDMNTCRRELVQLYKDIVQDKTPLPPQVLDAEKDEVVLENYPWVEPFHYIDYGYNIKIGKGAFINAGSTFIDTCTIEIGARTLVGPNSSFYSGTHSLDPLLRNGTNGPESGKPIKIGEDCWLGGNVTVLPGVTIGRGSTIGAGSVVTRDVPDFVVAVGNPARVLKKVDVASSGVAATGSAEALGSKETRRAS